MDFHDVSKRTVTDVWRLLQREPELTHHPVQIARRLGIGKSTAFRAQKTLDQGWTPDSDEESLGSSESKPLPAPISVKGVGMDPSAFLVQYDQDESQRAVIRRGLAKLSDRLVTDADFRKVLCGGASTVGWRAVTEEEEFRPYQFRCDDKVWWTIPERKQWALENISKAKEL